jgi:hypothetical protein
MIGLSFIICWNPSMPMGWTKGIAGPSNEGFQMMETFRKLERVRRKPQTANRKRLYEKT